MKHALVTCLAAYGLAACSPVALVASGGVAAIDGYCKTTSDIGKQAIRDRLSDGQAVIACSDLEGEQ